MPKLTATAASIGTAQENNGVKNGGVVNDHHGVGLKLSRLMKDAYGPAMQVFEGLKKALDPNGIMNPPTRTDIRICKIDAINVAGQLGNSKVYNMAVMGAYLKMKPIIQPENIDKGLAKCIPARYADLISLNKAAIEEGMKAVEVIL